MFLLKANDLSGNLDNGNEDKRQVSNVVFWDWGLELRYINSRVEISQEESFQKSTISNTKLTGAQVEEW